MKIHSFICLAMATLGFAQGVTEQIAPDGQAPDGCQADFSGNFQITVDKLTFKANTVRAAEDVDAGCASTSNLVVSLNNGVLTDGLNRTGYIASNYQFQFDGPPQAGALYTAGYSVCANNSLALGSSAVFWECASGTFYNLYDRKAADQCSPVEIIVIPCGDDADSQGGRGNAEGTPSGGVGQTVGSEIITTTVVIPLSDGQPQVITTTSVVYICQIGDGQVQGHSTPCDAAIPTITQAPVSQISDGQIQVTQISDGQVQVSQISDGQVQVSQISDGQVQVTGVPTASFPGEQVTTGPAVLPTNAPPSNGAVAGPGGGPDGFTAALVAFVLGGAAALAAV
ncbi:putative covalently-linked cell wall protein [Chaetomium sp. MPI-SDFR-AT-0129]|nr:putative covalently-linked cell wall protein [Chaetomium sp. MPI-SDFR-AT-0129]